MKIKTTIVVLVLFLSGIVRATEYNFATDYSTNTNPNGVWSYGWFHSELPGLSNLDVLSWNGTAWSATNGVAIWKNETSSTVNGVAPGQVALETTHGEPVVVRWTSPAAIGTASIQVDGELFQGTSGSQSEIQIRRGSSVLSSITNSGTFSIKLLVTPGEELDFVILAQIGDPIKPLNLTISTIEENRDFILLDDFDGYYQQDYTRWTTIPGYNAFKAYLPGEDVYEIGSDDYRDLGTGGYRNMPFLFDTNSSWVSFQYSGEIKDQPHYNSGWGHSIVAFCDNSITNGSFWDSSVVSYGLKAYRASGAPQTTPRLCVTINGNDLFSDSSFEFGDRIDIRGDMDWSYVGADGKHGLFSMFYRPTGETQWREAKGLQQIELKVPDLALITKLAVVLNSYHDYNSRFDQLLYCQEKKPNLGEGTNLLINANFADNTLAWDTKYGVLKWAYDWWYNGETPHDYPEIRFQDPTGRVEQVVNLLNQGFTPEDIDAGLYTVTFGGWLRGVSDGGKISVDFLDDTQQEIGSASLPPTSVYEWTEFMGTNAIPAQTRSIRYVFHKLNEVYSVFLDDAYLAVNGIPQEDMALTVSSAYGSPVPAVGTSSNRWGTTVNCSVENVVSGSTQYECIGWNGTGSVPTTGTSNTVGVTLMAHSTITWNWQTNYWLEVSVSGNGLVDVPDGFYTKGSEQILTATPDAGWLFMGWSGAASGTNEAFVMMAEPQAITATFSDDADGDGLTNTEEETYGSDPWNPDTDGDGFGDKLEVDHNWNPTVSDQWAVDYIGANGNDFGLYPSNIVLDVAVGQILLETVGDNATLNLQLKKSDDLITWTNAGDVVEWVIPVGDEKQYFRVRSEK